MAAPAAMFSCLSLCGEKVMKVLCDIKQEGTGNKKTVSVLYEFKELILLPLV